MPPLMLTAAIASALLSALALYAASPHCRLPAAMRLRAGQWIGGLLALVSLWLWIAAHGVGAGVSLMLGSWMLGLVVIPYLATWFAGGTRERR